MIEWRTAADWSSQGLPDLPTSKVGLIDRAKREGWKSQKRQGRGGGLEYHYSSLPDRARAAYLLRHRKPAASAAPTEIPQDEAWASFDQLSQTLKDKAAFRLKVLTAVEALVDGGVGRVSAVEMVAADAEVSPATVRRWVRMVKGVERRNWLPALAPRHVGKTDRAECDPRAWDWYLGQYLTRRGPSHADTYRRLEEIAAIEGWVIPSAKTLERRVETDIDPLSVVLMREGMEALARRLPKQRRDETVFAAGEAVNGDGLKFDKLWVEFPDGEILNTATAWFFQDLRTRRILAWRLGKTENTDLFRLATYDLTGVCAPTVMYIDNTRVAANKLMTAGAENRRRFKKGDHDGVGLLIALGIEPRFTNPDKETGNPGAKPIERAFGIGGLHDKVATHPSLIDRGYSKATAIPYEELRAVIEHEVARHNAQTKRRTTACRGILSFDQAWEEATASITFRRFSERQRRLLLMVREVVSVSQTGEIAINAGRGAHAKNRYWTEASAALAGRKVVAHFDPENLHAGIHVYSLDGRYLFEADHMTSTAFNDTEKGREWNKNRARMIKAAKKQAEATTRMSKLEREELYGKAVRARAEEAGDPPAAPASSVVAAHFRQMPDPARDAEQPKVAPGVIDFAAMAARQRPSELAEDDDEQAEFMRRALAGVRARNGLPPAE
ncbi:Bacteriophage Mu transposase [Pseudoruegeria aquimaris]|uniref:Bacteriophage Mu transposase n=1 Tax=Pseudoruegeria aquimaris TaxID=393663 RepID=A0A1Y5STZ9_9RHOB|nr:transposase domain-containing protein [Pseudoruegeria aquimaris]SLN48043.1 Bacteriophage Mu transposase [Pseudoruegeria aquimaris]